MLSFELLVHRHGIVNRDCFAGVRGAQKEAPSQKAAEAAEKLKTIHAVAAEM